MRPERVASGVVIAALASPVTSWVADRLAAQPSLCPLYLATGTPCPSCGGTRALVHLAAGDPLAALGSNPGVTVFAALVGALVVAGVVSWHQILGVAKPPEPVAHFSR